MNYGVTFPIFTKVDVNGNEASPLFYYLKKKAPFQGFDESNISNKLLKMMIADKYPEWSIGDEIKWNFTKFLIDQDGNVIKRYESTVGPMKMAEDIENLLATTKVAE
jgi:glutathione peroxidase